MKSTEEYETIIAELEKENERLKEENEIVWDMCNELRASDIRFNENLQNMLKSVLLKRLSALTSPTGEEMLFPAQLFRCTDCKHINKEFLEQ